MVQPVVTLQLLVWLLTKIFKSHYLSFSWSNFKTKDSSRNLLIKRIIGEKPIFYFECFTSRNPCDSSPPPRAKIRLVTLEKFLKHGFSFFHLNLPFSFKSWSRWHFHYLISRNPHLSLNSYLDLKLENFLSHEEELVFQKF